MPGLLENICPEDEFAKRCFIDAFNEAFKEVLEEQGVQVDKIDCNQFSNASESLTIRFRPVSKRQKQRLKA